MNMFIPDFDMLLWNDIFQRAINWSYSINTFYTIIENHIYFCVRKLIKITILTYWAEEEVGSDVSHIVQLFASGLDAGYKQLQLAFPSLPSNKVSNQGSFKLFFSQNE